MNEFSFEFLHFSHIYWYRQFYVPFSFMHKFSTHKFLCHEFCTHTVVIFHSRDPISKHAWICSKILFITICIQKQQIASMCLCGKIYFLFSTNGFVVVVVVRYKWIEYTCRPVPHQYLLARSTSSRGHGPNENRWNLNFAYESWLMAQREESGELQAFLVSSLSVSYSSWATLRRKWSAPWHATRETDTGTPWRTPSGMLSCSHAQHKYQLTQQH